MLNLQLEKLSDQRFQAKLLLSFLPGNSELKAPSCSLNFKLGYLSWNSKMLPIVWYGYFRESPNALNFEKIKWCNQGLMTLCIILLQVTNFWNNVLNEAEKTRLVNNIAGHLKDAKEFLQKRAVSTILCFNYLLITSNYQNHCPWYTVKLIYYRFCFIYFKQLSWLCQFIYI